MEQIAQLRNRRIEFTNTAYKLESVIYHCLTRKAGIFEVHEQSMDLINISKIQKIEKKKGTISFRDDLNDYSFNLSKSTLFKRFTLKKPSHQFDVAILENPFELILNKELSIPPPQKRPCLDYVFLPLYSRRNGDMEPGLGSGLNQWNAKGRARDPNEVYLPVPTDIHRVAKEFFPRNRVDTFSLLLPNGEKLSAKMCQDGEKGLMSNPNKALGKWILRDVLKLKEGTIVTRKILDEIGIDSIYIEKIDQRTYKLDFAKLGSFESFNETYLL